MPSMNTHKMFADDVLKKLNKKQQKIISESYDLYSVFSNSFDIFFYYQYFLPFKAAEIRKFARYAHRNNSFLYLLNIIRTIIKHNKESDPEALAYLYGSITHYVLDSTIHPFIFYKTGTYNKSDKETFKYNSKHGEMENMIDAYLYEKKTGNSFYKYRFFKELIPKVKPSKDIINIMNEVYDNTFHKKDLGKYYFKSYKWSRYLYKLFLYDRFGIKRLFYKFIDKLTPRKKKIQYYSYYIKNINLDYLNLDNKKWNHPSIKEMEFTYSFLDLYEMSVDRAVKIINEIQKVFDKEKDMKSLSDDIPNLSYITGLLITKNKPMKYFEY